jgi:SEC-C motif
MTDEYDPQTEMQAIHKQVGGWFDAFVGSPDYQRLTEIQKDKAPGIIRFFTEYSFRYIGAAPEQWNGGVLTECCVEILPRKMSAELPFFEAVAPVLSAFFDFLAGKGLLSKARELSAAVAELDAEIVAASQNERNWGPAKAFIMAAEKAGVDTCDRGAMDRFLIEHNLRLLARLEARQAAPVPSFGSVAAPAAPIRHPQPKPGRNDLCPCGSGKKFKKCCGA